MQILFCHGTRPGSTLQGQIAGGCSCPWVPRSGGTSELCISQKMTGEHDRGCFMTHFVADQSISMARGIQSLISARLPHTISISSVIAQCWAIQPTSHSNLGQPAPHLPPPASPPPQLGLCWLPGGILPRGPALWENEWNWIGVYLRLVLAQQVHETEASARRQSQNTRLGALSPVADGARPSGDTWLPSHQP